ncbi:MAG: formate dehydrogenase accessory sulfurtransferase FdhD [Candidatus Hydrothermarchaeota archaeon]
MYKRVNAKKIDLSGFISRDDTFVVDEEQIRIFANGKKIGVFSTSPNLLKELAIGYLIGSGMIKDSDDIEDIEIMEDAIEVKIPDFDENKLEIIRMEECVQGWVVRLLNQDIYVNSDLRVGTNTLYDAMKKLQKHSRIWKLTHGTHAAGIFDKNGKEIAIAEDISRHAVIDKVIGISTLKKVDFLNTFLLCSGRIPASMILKVANANIPIIGSRSAPINPSIDVAREVGITLICFLRGRKMYVYTGDERIYQ